MAHIKNGYEIDWYDTWNDPLLVRLCEVMMAAVK